MLIRRIFALSIMTILATSIGRSEDRKDGGLKLHRDGASAGYTLFAPMRSTSTYLVDMEGKAVHEWKGEHPPGQAVYLLDNGHLLKCASPRRTGSGFHGGGIGGLIREFDWDGKLVWEYLYCNKQHCQHHDVEPLPNGNVLIIAWEKKSEAEASAAGRDPELLDGGELWPDHVVEVKPAGKDGGEIVWEWHVWDHLVQDFDPGKANYGEPSEHPELIDVNYVRGARRNVQASGEELERLRALGYVGGEPPHGGGPEGGADWCHTNSVAYNAELDQVMLSVLGFNEIWIIDHSTTTAEAAGHSGGKCGRGGDLLYRWGNPQAYGAGGEAEQRLFAQHDARWIPAGSPGAGHILVFNNGRGRPDGEYTTVDEIAPPLKASGGYALGKDGRYGPSEPCWFYEAPTKTDFFAGHISGAQRLPNGDTLICSGEQGRLFETTREGVVVWDYVNPFASELRAAGPPPFMGGGDRSPRDRGPRPGRPGPRPPRGPHGPRGQGPPPGGEDEARAVFRATRIGPDHPGLKGREF